MTEEGQRLLDRVGDAIAVLDDAVGQAGLRAGDAALSGLIRINGPAPALELRLMPLVTSFLRAHPAVRFDIVSEGELVDVVERGFDAGVRYDETLEQDMVAVRLGRAQRMIIAGSPDYLERKGIPARPDDLRDHACIAHRFARGNLLPWSLQRDAETIEVNPDGRLRVNTAAMARIAALDGVGLVYAFDDDLERDLEDGRLICVLGDWTPPFPAPSLYFTERRLMPRAFRAFVDHIKRETREA
ncbi:MAG: LysR substrate-binding domain-containing protein [Dokdonella sp.]